MSIRQHLLPRKLLDIVRHKDFVIITLFIVAVTLFNVTGNMALASTEIHEHKARDIGRTTPVPKIQLSAFRDPIDGVNIHLEVDNYLLNVPDLATITADDKVDGVLQGHAHVFVNGIKRQRLYGKDVHIPQSWLKEGVNQVAVSLNSHKHENWMSGDHNIVSSVFLDLSKQNIVLHYFTSQPIKATSQPKESNAEQIKSQHAHH
ncbi:hypothetical protein Patl_0782 [Paraglaciecola sp. T6c]|uniref:hypothetical protein n=1 Tax=Pseudoalteromonas atlantica (strain T6c / ATCC BAA-1087) TaxID=3042615 RepID=UPI00005C5F06|nr:hypothetical protein [Paraglaciecola sp. T6c]ABG39310.1 hypothetical protein Patl_0782 [Paraglaciecola sp. T6c]